jgi:hypothetical protein
MHTETVRCLLKHYNAHQDITILTKKHYYTYKTLQYILKHHNTYYNITIHTTRLQYLENITVPTKTLRYILQDYNT